MRAMKVADLASSNQAEKKGSWKERFKGFNGLSSTVRGTKGQLQRLLTTQLTDYSAWSPPEVGNTAAARAVSNHFVAAGCLCHVLLECVKHLCMTMKHVVRADLS